MPIKNHLYAWKRRVYHICFPAAFSFFTHYYKQHTLYIVDIGGMEHAAPKINTVLSRSNRWSDAGKSIVWHYRIFAG